MVHVLWLKPSDIRGYLRLGCQLGEEKAVLTVSEEVYREIGSPLRGAPLSEENFAYAKEASDRVEALRAALRLLGYADNSARTLTAKLLRRGYSPSVARAAVEEVIRLGYLDEDRQISLAVLREANEKLHGPRRIVAALAAKGYDSRATSRILRSLIDAGEIDLSKNLSLLYKKKSTHGDLTEEERRKWKYQYGYGRSDE